MQNGVQVLQLVAELRAAGIFTVAAVTKPVVSARAPFRSAMEACVSQ